MATKASKGLNMRKASAVAARLAQKRISHYQKTLSEIKQNLGPIFFDKRASVSEGSDKSLVITKVGKTDCRFGLNLAMVRGAETKEKARELTQKYRALYNEHAFSFRELEKALQMETSNDITAIVLISLCSRLESDDVLSMLEFAMDIDPEHIN